MSESRKVIALVKATIAVPIYEGEEIATVMSSVEIGGAGMVALQAVA